LKERKIGSLTNDSNNDLQEFDIETIKTLNTKSNNIDVNSDENWLFIFCKLWPSHIESHHKGHPSSLVLIEQNIWKFFEKFANFLLLKRDPF